MHNVLTKLFSLLILFVVCIRTQENFITLLDILQPNSNTRLYDQLSATVQEEYGQKPIQFDASKLISFDPKPISIPTINEKYRAVLYDGDMVISTKQLQRFAEQAVEEGEGGTRSKRKAYVDNLYPTTIWTNGVPYEFHFTLSLKSRLSIQRAIRFWQENTCVEFRPRSNEDVFLLFVGYEDGCWSTVGRDDTMRQQIVSLGRGCEHFGVTSHELAHALGVFHEQSRYDRDQFVSLNSRTVEGSLLYNFAKIGPRELNTYNLPYDVGSVMHYAPTEFSNSRRVPALTTVDPNLQQTMGTMDKPSFLDVQAINIHYKCAQRCANQLTCYNGGYQDPRSCDRCKCPDGFGGQTCSIVQPSFSRHCGGDIQVEQRVRRFDITILQTGSTIKSKECYYLLKAPPGKRILVNLLQLSGKCVEGCYVDAAEFKMGRDFRPVGYRFCCAESQLRRLVSATNVVPLIVYSRKGSIQMTLEYTSIDERAAHDFAPLQQADLVRLNTTAYETIAEQSSKKLGLSMKVKQSR